MKKIFICTLGVICLALLCLTLIACGPKASVTMEDLVRVNCTESILTKYSNYHVIWSRTKDAMPQNVLICNDYIYYEGEKVQELYSHDGRTYERDLDVGRYVATIKFPEEVDAFIKHDYFKTPVINAGAKDEEILSITKADEYQITVTTKLSPERSAEVVNSFADDGSFAYVKAVYLISRETLHINELNYYCVRENGTQRELASANVSYDAKGMWDAENMYAHMTDKAYEFRTVTIILDPDTANERSISVVARKGDPISLALGDGYKAVYTDRECTLPYKSDGTYSNDETLYCKKTVVNDKLIQMSDIVAFNTTESILSVFDSYYVQWSALKNGMGPVLYTTQNYVYYLNNGTPELYAGEHTYEKSDEYYVATLREQSEVSAFLANPFFVTPLIDADAASEDIIIRESNDYYHYVTTKLSSERSANILKAFDEANVYDYVKARYTVTRATFAITSLSYYGVTKHGDEIKIAEATVEYDVTGVTDADEMYAHLTDEAFDRRTVTVILDPDTPAERSVSALARRGDPVALRVGSSYTVLCTDRECKNPYKNDGTYLADQTLYCKSNVSAELDMNAVKAEIDSLSASDFEKTENITSYVKITFADYGEVVIRLRADVAPITVENFQSLVSQNFYDGLTMHRIIKDFMIQGGSGKETPPAIKGEFKVNGVENPLSHIPGVISMARTYVYDSAASQFFIVSGPDALHLDGYYAAFGYVVAGLDVVTTIHTVETDSNDTPITKIVIEEICFVNQIQ